MDPNIMKLLEEDEDEAMHSGADVDAFTAELNRDIEGNASTSQQQRSSPMMQQHELIDERDDSEMHSQDLDSMPHISSLQSGPQPQNDQNTFNGLQPGGTQTSIHVQRPNHESNSEDSRKLVVQNTSDDQFTGRVQNNIPAMVFDASYQPSLSTGKGIQATTNTGTSMMNQYPLGMGVSSQERYLTTGMAGQQPTTSGNQQQGVAPKLNKQLPFGVLLPIILPQLNEDRAVQLNSLYSKLKKNEIAKAVFVKHMRSIVGDKMVKMALHKLQTQAARNSQTAPGQFQSHPHAGRQMQAPSGQMLSDSNNDNSVVKSREVENFATLHGLNKQPNMHFSQTSFTAYATAGNSYPPYSGNIVPSSASLGQHPLESHMSRPNHLGPPNQGMNTMNMPGKLHVGGPTHLDSYNTLQQNQVHCPSSISQEQRVGISSLLSHVKQEPFDQPSEHHKNKFSSQHRLSSGPLRPDNLGPGNFRDGSFEMQSSRIGITPSSGPLSNRVSSLISPIGSGNILKASAQKKSVTGQKPMETPESSPPSSKKQKVSEALLDQSIEHLNDVTAVSGVDLREEEEQLFSSPKEDSRVSEASRRVVQEEEERLILNKIPLQKMLVETMAKFGLQNVGNDVEQCLSLCVEERLRGLVTKLIRVKNYRVAGEQRPAGTIITSDVRQQILSINNKAREEWEKKQAETEKSQNPDDEMENVDGDDADQEKGESLAKSTKTTNKEEDEKMRATAANVAVRAATGVDDMLSRWQLMVEAKQKHVVSDASSGSLPDKDVTKKTSTMEHEEGDSSLAALTTTASPRNEELVARRRRSITVKDLLAVLERDPQLAKSTLLYRLYNRVTDAADAQP